MKLDPLLKRLMQLEQRKPRTAYSAYNDWSRDDHLTFICDAMQRYEAVNDFVRCTSPELYALCRDHISHESEIAVGPD